MATTPGNIDVTRGGGEFGRGFYTQYSERRALQWAIRCSNRINGLPCVLRLDIDDNSYGNMDIQHLNDVSGPHPVMIPWTIADLPRTIRPAKTKSGDGGRAAWT